MKRILMLAGVLYVSIVPAILAANPGWWTDSGTAVIDAEASHDASENYAPANLGQLKNVAAKAKLHLDNYLPDGGAGDEIDILIAGFEPRLNAGHTQAEIDAFIADNYAPINLGQLKAVAKRFYDRLKFYKYPTGDNLISHGYPLNKIYDGYPWNPATPSEENYAPANLGQLKMVFSFDLSAPAGQLPSWWLAHFFPGEAEVLPGSDPDLDGLTNLQEFQQQSNPTDYYSQGSVTIVPTLTVVSGNNQFAQAGSTTVAPLVVKVTDASNTPLNNAPVTFTVTMGGGLLASAPGGVSVGTSYSTRTSIDGTANIYFKPTGFADNFNQLTATTSTLSVNLNSTTVGGEASVNGRQVSSRGQYYSVALRNDGTVWAWGQNNWGQLGNNTMVDSAVPVQVSGLSGIVSIATGDNFSAALKNDGTVWTWGYNNYGQIGDNTTTTRTVPVSVPGLSGVVAIACGGAHILAVKSDGTLMAWGQNLKGQVGNNTIVNSRVPVAVSGLTNVVGIAAGGNHSAAVTSDGTVWTWGYNLSGQLGDNTVIDSLVPKQISSGTLSGVRAVSAGYAHTIALKSDGTVKGWGNNGNGQLGTGTMGTSRVPIAFGTLTGITSISAGYSQTLARRFDGTTWGSGINILGQLGDGTTTRRLSPVNLPDLNGVESLAGGTNHAMAVTSSGMVLVWGGNTRGELGQGVLSESNVPLPIPGLSDVTNLSAGNLFATALKSNGTVVAWGSNDRGQLGNGTTIPRFVPGPVLGLSQITAVANGGSYALALTSDGNLLSWGENTNGQLGDNTTTDRSTPVAVSGLTGVTAVVATSGASLALKSDGTVWSWGANTLGQLGINASSAATPNSKVPVQVVGTSGGFLTGITAIAGAGNHFAALASDGTLYTWGENANGQLGNNTTTNSILPIQVETGVASIAAGANFMIAQKANGSVWTWGQNASGQLGNNTTTDSLVPTAISALSGVQAFQAGASHALAIKSDGTVLVWGLNANGQLGDGTITQRKVPVANSGLVEVTKIVGGSSFSLALKKDGTVYAFGGDDYGQLGLNIGQFKAVPQSVLGLHLTSSIMPAITLNAPSSSTLNAGDSVTFTTSVTGNPWKVEFFEEGVKIGEDTTAPFELEWITPTWGQPHISAIASTLDGRRSTRSGVHKLTIAYNPDPDTDGDEMPDAWEVAHGFDPNDPDEDNNGIDDGLDDLDKDGLTNLLEYQQGSDPRDYYSQGSTTVVPVLTVVGGNDQVGFPNAYLTNPLQVQVRNSSGNALLSDAPVAFNVTLGGGGLSTTGGNPVTAPALTVRTDSNGIAHIYFKQGEGVQVSNIVTVHAGSGTAVTFESQTTGETLAGQWKFNEGSGTVTEDESLYGNHGMLTNNPQWTTRQGGLAAINFTGAVVEGGTSNYVTMGNPSDRSLDFGSSSFSIAFWTKFSEITTLAGSESRRILGKGLDSYDAGYAVFINGSGHLWAGVGASTSSKADSLLFRTNDPINDDEWHLVTVVFDRENATAQIYVDGVAQGLAGESGAGGVVDPLNPAIVTYPDLTNLTATRADMPLIVGSRGGALDFFKGSIDDLQIFRKALTPEDIAGFDYDADGLPDNWEMDIVNADPNDDINSVADVDPNGNLDGDSLTNFEEWELGLDPLDPSDALGKITITSGNKQTAAPGQTIAQPISLHLTDFLNRDMAGQTIRARISDGGGLIRAVGGSAYDTSCTLTTNELGVASVECQAGNVGGFATRVTIETDFSAAAEAVFYTSGWLGIWKFDEGDGTMSADQSGFNRNAVFPHAAWLSGVDAKMKSSLLLSSVSNDVVSVEGSSSMDVGAGSLTGMLWIKTSQSTQSRILGQGFFGDKAGFALDIGVGGAGRLSFAIGVPDGGSNIRITTVNAFNDDLWHHVSFVIDRTSATVGILVDGVRQNVQLGEIPAGASVTSASVAAAPAQSSTEPLILGLTPRTEVYIDAAYDEFRLHRGVLSDNEIARHAGVFVDSDGDGIPDAWEQEIIDADSSDNIDDLSDVLPEGDFDQDGISNLDEYLAGSSPVNYYNGKNPVLQVVSGSGQVGEAGVLLASPIRIDVKDQEGQILFNAPIHVQPNDPTAAVGGSATTLSGSIDLRTSSFTKFYIRP